jgi:hypothetical protein
MPSDSCLRISLSGDATIRGIGDVHQKISSALHENEEVEVDIGELADFDLTFVQLVEAARRTATNTGKKLALASPASGPLLEMLQRGGFMRTPGGADFWLCGRGGA